MFGTLYLYQTFTNCVLRQKCRDEKLTFVIYYGYITLVPKYNNMSKKTKKIDIFEISKRK